MKEISSALVKAQKAFGPALKTNTNPHFKNRYAGLDACIEAVIDGLHANGIMLMQPTHECTDGVIVETLFVHESGEMLSGGKLHVPSSKHDAQGYGSALTYARRYSLMSACGMAPTDDDGEAARKSSAAAPAASEDMSPKARANRIEEGVKNGDAAGAATAMAGWSDKERNGIWALLKPATQTTLTDNWPKD